MVLLGSSQGPAKVPLRLPLLLLLLLRLPLLLLMWLQRRLRLLLLMVLTVGSDGRLGAILEPSWAVMGPS
jgi:hypothetical protein